MRFRKAVLATTILASLFILMAGLALAAWYERQASISQTPTLVSAYADVAASGREIAQEYVAVVWSEGSPGHAGALKLRWAPPGEKWQYPPIVIEDSSSKSREPAVAVYSATAYIAYVKEQGTNWVVGYAECTYGGSCTKSQVHAQSDAVGSADIAYCNGTRHVVWADATGSDDDVWYSSFTDGGNWTSPLQVSTSGTNSSPSVACYSDTVHVTWIEEDSSGNHHVRYANNSDWGSIKAVRDSGTTELYNTSIAAYGDYVDVVWDEDAGSDYYYVGTWRWSEKTNWGCRTTITGTFYSPSGGSEYQHYLQPDVAVYSYTSSTHPIPAAVWHDRENREYYYILYSYGTDFGGTQPQDDCKVTWSVPEIIAVDDDNEQDSAAPSIAFGFSGTVTHTHVVFQRQVMTTTYWDIYYTSNYSSTWIQGEPPHNDVYLPIILKNYR